MDTQSKYYKIRTDSLKHIPNLYPKNTKATHTIPEFIENYGQVDPETVTNVFSLNGRIQHIRVTSTIIFLQIYGQGEFLQVMCDDMTKKYLKVGDIIHCVGTLNRSKRNELSLKSTEIQLIAPCMKILQGTTNNELYFRMITDVKLTKNFVDRSLMAQKIRKFFEISKFVECPNIAMENPIATVKERLDVLKNLEGCVFEQFHVFDVLTDQEEFCLSFCTRSHDTFDLLDKLFDEINIKHSDFMFISDILKSLDVKFLKSQILRFDLEFPKEKTVENLLYTLLPAVIPKEFNGSVSYFDGCCNVLEWWSNSRILARVMSKNTDREHLGILFINNINMVLSNWDGKVEIFDFPIETNLENEIIKVCDKLMFS